MSCSTRHLPSCTPSSPFANRVFLGTLLSHQHSKSRDPAAERPHPTTGIDTITPPSVPRRHQQHRHVYRHKGQHQGSRPISQGGRAGVNHPRATSPSLTRAHFELLWAACPPGSAGLSPAPAEGTQEEKREEEFCLCPRARSSSFRDNSESDHLAQKTLHLST